MTFVMATSRWIAVPQSGRVRKTRSVNTSDTAPAISVESVTKRFGEVLAVDNVSLTINQGEVLALLGPNGAGKTTSFYMTTGLVVPNGGRIFLDNEEITTDPV